MEASARLNVDFKPAKRMKKRRELDALVSGGKTSGSVSSGGGGGRGAKNGKHELLRNDSESSDVEEFSLPDESSARKRQQQQRCGACSTCLSIWWALLLVACLISVAGLFFLHFQLKADVELLRKNVQAVDDQGLAKRVTEMRTEQDETRRIVDALSTGDNGVEGIVHNLSLLIGQVSTLNATTKQLTESVASSAELMSLPQQLKDLSKSVAAEGSNVQALQGDVQRLQEARAAMQKQIEDLDARILALQLDEVSKMKTTTPAVAARLHDDADLDNSNAKRVLLEMDRLSEDIKAVNSTLAKEIEDLETHSSSQAKSLSELRNYTTLLNTRLTFVELKPSAEQKVESVSQAVVAQMIDDAITLELEDFRNVTTRERGAELATLTEHWDASVSQLQAQCGNDSYGMAQLRERVGNVSSQMDRWLSTSSDDITSLNNTILEASKRVETIERKMAAAESSMAATDEDKMASISPSTINESSPALPQSESAAGQESMLTPVGASVKQIELTSTTASVAPVHPEVRAGGAGSSRRKRAS